MIVLTTSDITQEIMGLDNNNAISPCLVPIISKLHCSLFCFQPNIKCELKTFPYYPPSNYYSKMYFWQKMGLKQDINVSFLQESVMICVQENVKNYEFVIVLLVEFGEHKKSIKKVH